MIKEEKKFIIPEVQIIEFRNEDIITGSNLGEEDEENIPGY